MIDKDALSEAMYEPGVASMFRKGILYIEDMDTKKELGLEPDGATEPENIIVLTGAQMTRYLKVAPARDLDAAAFDGFIVTCIVYSPYFSFKYAIASI